jgi:ketopantoate reductase
LFIARGWHLDDAFGRARGVEATASDDIERAMWIKFVFIAGVSGVGSATRAPAGVIRSLPETRDLLARAMEEVRTVGVARGIALPDDLVMRILGVVDDLPTDQIPSMQRDVLAGRPSELEAQIGAWCGWAARPASPRPCTRRSTRRCSRRSGWPVARATRSLRRLASCPGRTKRSPSSSRSSRT